MVCKRAAELALLCCVALSPIALEGEDRRASEQFRARSLSYPYGKGAIFAMPGETIPLSVNAPATRLHRIDAPQGALVATGPNKWSWEAPLRPGLYPLKVKSPSGDTVADFSAFVMVPSKSVQLDGKGATGSCRVASEPQA